MSRRFSGRTALVTGASRGIGLAIADGLAAEGADIALHVRAKTETADRLAADLARRYGVRAHAIAADLADPAQLPHSFADFDRQFDRLDILINNAGYETPARLEAMSLADWNGVIAVNLTAPFLLSQLAQPRMAAAGGGVIVNISSIHDEVPRKGFAHYSVAKAGLRMLTRSSALEWAEFGIRAVTVSPGAIETDINRDVIESIGRDVFDDWIPLGMGTTGDVSGLVNFVCSDAARYITGTEIYLDGGYMRNRVRYDGRPT